MWLVSLLAQASPTGTEGGAPPLMQFVPFILIMGMMFFFIWSSNRKREKAHQAMVATLKADDKVVNSGGIIGVVAAVKDKEDEVVLKGGLRITKSSIVRIVREEAAKE